MSIFKRFLLFVLLTPLVLIALFFYATQGFCTNSDGHLIWYTKNNSCRYINYESCSLFKKRIPFNATANCSDEQKIAVLQRSDILLIGAPWEPFSKLCSDGFEQIYNPKYDGVRECAIANFTSTWGLEGRAIPEACRLHISEKYYIASLSAADMGGRR